MKIRRRTWILLTVALPVTVLIVVCWPNPDRSYRIGPVLGAGIVEPQLAVDWNGAVLLAPNGTLWIWGGSPFQLASLLPARTTTETPLQIGTDSDWVKMSATQGQFAAIKSDGSLWSLGNSGSGELASPPRSAVPSPIRIGTENDWVEIAAGAGHVMALKRDGSLWLWGQNDSGQIGNGTTNNVHIPFRVPGEHHWSAISAGSHNSYALADNGSLWGWGLTGNFPAATAKDDLSPTLLSTNTVWKSISAGSFHLMALKEDGTLWLRGQNAASIAPRTVWSASAQLVQVGTDTNWTSIDSTGDGYVALKDDGTWWRGGFLPWKDGFLSAPTRGSHPDLRPLEDDFDPWVIGGGGNATVVLNRDGRLWTCGTRLGSADQFVLLRRAAVKLNHLFGGNAYSGFLPKTDFKPHLIFDLSGRRSAPHTSRSDSNSPNGSNTRTVPW